MTIVYNYVSMDDLMPGKKYLIYYRATTYPPYIITKGTFINYTYELRNDSSEDDYEYDDGFCNVSFYLSKSNRTLICSEIDKFFEMIPQKHKIQNAMELRAVNQLLQRIIGDDTFTYL